MKRSFATGAAVLAIVVTTSMHATGLTVFSGLPLFSDRGATPVRDGHYATTDRRAFGCKNPEQPRTKSGRPPVRTSQ